MMYNPGGLTCCTQSCEFCRLGNARQRKGLTAPLARLSMVRYVFGKIGRHAETIQRMLVGGKVADFRRRYLCEEVTHSLVT